MLRTVRRVGSKVLVVGGHGKLVVAFPGAQNIKKIRKVRKTKTKMRKHQNVLDGGANVILEDSAFSSYCLLETDNKSR